MPNYKASFFWFPNVAAMSSFLLDNTDEDGLVFAVGVDTTNWKIATWRKNSTAAIDNSVIYAANGPGRWVVLDSTPIFIPVWNSDISSSWNSDLMTNWNVAG
ncbi:MAG: hypothetical protein RLZZ532_4166 [Cyanobacteriota bacterium]|jgi:hypothetical protein